MLELFKRKESWLIDMYGFKLNFNFLEHLRLQPITPYIIIQIKSQIFSTVWSICLMIIYSN